MAHGELLADLLPLRAVSETDFLVSTTGRVRKDDLVFGLSEDAIEFATAAALAAVNERLGGVINVRQTPFLMLGDDTNITDTQINLLQDFMNSIGGTSFGQEYPDTTAKAVQFQGGRFKRSVPTVITTWGTGADIIGDGPATVLDNINFQINQFRCGIDGLYLISAAGIIDDTIALDLVGDARRYSDIGRVWISDKDIGIRYSGTGGFDVLNRFRISDCRVGIKIERTLGIVASVGLIIGAIDYGVEIASDGEFKLSHAIIRGAGIANLYIHGSGLRPVVEHYLTDVTLTGADARTIPILSVTDNGGFVRLVLREKIGATIEDRGAITYGGTVSELAQTYVQLAGEAGQLDSIDIDGDELLSAAIPFAGTLALTAAAAVTNINAGTGTHGYTAQSTGQFVYVFAPGGTAYNGLVVTPAASGGLTATGRKFCAVVCDAPHGFVDGTLNVISLMEYSDDPYDGIMPVRGVEDANTFLTDLTFSEASTGEVWRPHFMVPILSQVRIANSGGAWDKTLNITAIDDVSITTDVPFVGFPALPGSAIVSVPGWDLIMDVDGANNVRANDQFINGGNINYALFLSGASSMFKGTRFKCQAHIVKRANRSFQCAGMHFEFPPRARGEESWETLPISGHNSGWTMAGPNMGGSSGAGDGYYMIRTPNKDLPLVNGIAQTNEFRQYEDRVEIWIGPLKAMELDNAFARLNGFRGRHITNGENFFEFRDAIAGSGPQIRSETDDPDDPANANLNVEFITRGTGSHDFATNGGTTQARIEHVADANRIVRMRGGAAGAGARLASSSSTELNIEKPSFALVPSQTPLINADLVAEMTNNTTITWKLKGNDGVVRTKVDTFS